MEFARNHLGFQVEDHGRQALQLVVAEFLGHIASELREVLPKEMHLAALSEIKANIDAAAKGLARKLDGIRAELKLTNEQLAGRRLLTPSATYGELAAAVDTYCRVEAKELEGGLQARIERLLREEAGDLKLPPIRQLYVRAGVRPNVREWGEPAGLDEVSRHRTPSTSRPPADEARLPPLLGFLSHRLVTLTGAPGSGKSTELRRTGEHLLSELAEGSRRAVPVYLRLPDLDGALLDVLRERFSHAPALLATSLAGAHGVSLVLLLDSFDEVSATRGRKAAKEALRIVAGHPGATAILAGRAQAEGDCWGEIPRFDRVSLTLEPLDRDRQLELVSRFSGLIPDARLADLRGILEGGSGRLAELLARPLYLMAAVAVAAIDEGELPGDAAGLMQAFLPPLVRVCLAVGLVRLGSDADEMARHCLTTLERLAASAAWLAAGKSGVFSASTSRQRGTTLCKSWSHRTAVRTRCCEPPAFSTSTSRTAGASLPFLSRSTSPPAAWFAGLPSVGRVSSSPSCGRQPSPRSCRGTWRR